MMTTTLILGAGFSKCADLPLQNQFPALLLAPEFDNEIDTVITEAVRHFLSDVFGWQEGNDLPPLEDVFTFIDLSAGSGHHLGIKYSPKMLRALRRMMIYRIFSILDRRFSYSDDITKLLNSFYDVKSSKLLCDFVVLNWDIVLEKHLQNIPLTIPIDYCAPCFDWLNPVRLSKIDTGTRVCKMHGSSNWVYCDNCKSLFYDLNQKLPLQIRAGLIKSDFRLFDEGFTDTRFDEALGISSHGRECRFCKNLVSSSIATFSYRKSFRTATYPAIWHAAESQLAMADRWLFVGYSLPEADYELKHLLKTAQLQMSHLHNSPEKLIDVVALGDGTRTKFEGFFGHKNLSFHTGGLAEYVKKVR